MRPTWPGGVPPWPGFGAGDRVASDGGEGWGEGSGDGCAGADGEDRRDGTEDGAEDGTEEADGRVVRVVRTLGAGDPLSPGARVCACREGLGERVCG
ncbi:hypothetical protein [Microbispora triticiradicis]|uniref:hypothetical protein n=1 Tax=Microbispora triticiradicis TaxID=2200763 RepID=UPI001AD79ABE|nr:hypothetical protein [Microbispora triticiradicis]MBO4272517.1 hypothetical protein [Microbispora triticiradicis]